MLFLSLKVFLCRIVDVSLGTMRTIQVVRGNRTLAALIGFCETLLWFLVIREAFNSTDSGLMLAIAYAGGFACGTFVGIWITGKLTKTEVCLQVVTSGRDNAMIAAIRDAGFGVTVVSAMGSELSEDKYMLFIETDSRKKESARQLIHEMDPKAFVMVKETKMVYNGYFGSNA